MTLKFDVMNDQRGYGLHVDGDEIHELEPVTSIQFSGGVDAHRMICHGCIQDIIEVWNEGQE